MPNGTLIDPSKADAIRRVTAALDSMAELAAKEAAESPMPLVASHAPTDVRLMPSHTPRARPVSIGGRVVQRAQDFLTDTERAFGQRIRSEIQAQPVSDEEKLRLLTSAIKTGGVKATETERRTGRVEDASVSWLADPLGKVADRVDEAAGTVDQFNPLAAVLRLFSGDALINSDPAGPLQAAAKGLRGAAKRKGGRIKSTGNMIEDVLNAMVERGIIKADDSVGREVAEAVAKQTGDEDAMAKFFADVDGLADETAKAEAPDVARRAVAARTADTLTAEERKRLGDAFGMDDETLQSLSVSDIAEARGILRMMDEDAEAVVRAQRGTEPGQASLLPKPAAKIELEPGVEAVQGVMPSSGQGVLLADSDAAAAAAGKVEPVQPTMAKSSPTPTTLDATREQATAVPAARMEGAEFQRGVGDTKRALDEGGTFDEADPRFTGIKDAPRAHQKKADDARQIKTFMRFAGDDLGQTMFSWLQNSQNNLWRRRRMGMRLDEIGKRADDYVPSNETLKALENTSGWMPGSVEEFAGIEKAVAAQYDYVLTMEKEIADTLADAGVTSLDALKGATDPKLLSAREKLLTAFSDDAGRNLRSLDELAAFRSEQVGLSQAAMKVYQGARSEWGRAGTWLQKADGFLRSADAKFIARAMKGGVVPDKAFEFLAKMPDATSKMRFLLSLSKPGAKDWVRWYYMTSLLSNPKTHMRNIFGNITYNVLDMAGAPLRAALTKDGNAAAEFTAQWAGARQGAAEGWKTLKYVWDNGFSLDDAAVLAERPVTLAMGSKYEKGINAISRMLESVDQGLQAMGRQIEIHRILASRVRKEGHALGSQAFEKRFAELVADPPVDVLEAAKKHAKDLVYRQDPGSLTNVASQARHVLDEKTFGIGGTVLMPFIVTPANVFRAGFQHSPLGLLAKPGRSAVKAGFKDLSREEATRVVRSTLGTAAAGMIGLWALEGNVTGSAPSETAAADYGYANGPKPNSVRLPGTNTWVGIQNFGPLAVPLMAAANMADQYRRGDAEGFGANVGEYFARVSKSLLDQTFLSSMFGLVNAIADPERYGERFTSRTVSGMLPYSGAMRFGRDLVDDTLRDPDTMLESLAAGVPGLSQTVPERVDFTGQPAKRAQMLVGRVAQAISPVEVSFSKPTPAHDYLLSIGEYFPNPKANATSYAQRLGGDAEAAGKLDTLIEAGVLRKPKQTWKGDARFKLPHDLEVAYAKGIGEKRLALVNKIMESGALQSMTKEDQAKEVRRLFDKLTDRYTRWFTQEVVAPRVRRGALP